MKIAIISDIHDNLPNLKKVLDYCAKNKIKTIICCGDLASQETLEFLNSHFEGQVHYALGNAEEGKMPDFENGATYQKIKIFKDFGEAAFGGVRTAFVHYPEKARELCLSGRYGLVFYGHTHKPWEEMLGQCKMLNSGNVAGIIYLPTFAVWDTDSGKFELIRIHDLK